MKFSELNLHTPLQKALETIGYTHPTTIQQKAFSPILSGSDVVAIAQTGTGKTLAYLLPALRQWQYTKEKYTQIIILVPTRELVVQVEAEALQLTQFMSLTLAGVYGGVNIKPQRQKIHDGVDVLIATPGRLLDFVLDGTLKLKNLRKLIIDEVDEMLNLGFRAQVSRILDLLPAKRQNIMLSATLTEEVEIFIQNHFKSPVKIEAAPAGTPLEKITQWMYSVPNFNTKINLLQYLLKNNPQMQKVLVFVSTKQWADYVFEKMAHVWKEKLGIIHSNKSQNHRLETIKHFKSGSYQILIATDLVSRGIDVHEVSHVINFDVPESTENYIHRIGRTGRADKNGEAITLVAKTERSALNAIEKQMKKKLKKLDFPIAVDISDILMEHETPKTTLKAIESKLILSDTSGPSFHEKSAKNKKVNQHLTRAAKMKLKYGKPKTRLGKKKK